MIISMQLQIN